MIDTIDIGISEATLGPGLAYADNARAAAAIASSKFEYPLLPVEAVTSWRV